jgi:threonine dehydratase
MNTIVQTTSPALIDRILQARVYDVAIQSPLDLAPRLSARLGNQVYLKREDLQPVFSFKLRGAYNKISGLDAETLIHGVICSSAGNHAQGVALAARKRGIRAVIVMPTSTPSIKISAVRALGGEVILHGADYDAANTYALDLAQREAMAFVHPFADPEVIAGQGTIAAELAQQWQSVPHAVFVPIGGGGLISGIGCYLKHFYPDIRVIGVEPYDAPSMQRSLAHGAPVELEHVGTFADGVAVRRVSDLTFSIARDVVDEIILVDTDEICAAIKDVFEDCRVVVEPAGALSIAGLKRYVTDNGRCNESLIAVSSGANMNFDRLRHVSERAEIGEHREALIAVEIPEQKGAFLAFCEAIGIRNITEFNYRYYTAQTARIFVGVSIQNGRAETADLLQQLRQRGYTAIDMSDNEIAKLHLRHMVGGRGQGLDDEMLFRFEFPERPGALLRFLQAVGQRWNISLFHYRNHGSDYGRVLAGIQVPREQRSELAGHLDSLGYEYFDESANPAYQMFLGADPVAQD